MNIRALLCVFVLTAACAFAQINRTTADLIQQGDGSSIADAGANDSYTGCPLLSISAYKAGMTLWLKPNTANTGAASINVCGLGVKSIKQADGSTDPTDGQLATGVYTALNYNGTVFTLPAGSGAGGAVSSVAGRTGAVVLTSRDATDFTPTVTSSTVGTIAAGIYGSGTSTYNLTGSRTFTLETATVTSGTIGATTTLNASGSPNFTNLVTGQSVNVSGITGTGCSVANGVFVATRVSATQITIPANTTGLTCNFTTTPATVGANSGGQIYVYGDDQGNITVDHPAALGAIIATTGASMTKIQSTTPDMYPGGVPIAIYDVTAGALTGVTDKRRFMSGTKVNAGANMDVTQSAGQYLIGTAANVMTMDGTNTGTGSFVNTAAARTAPCRTNAGVPTGQNGTVGDCVINTSGTPGSNFYIATTTGTPATWSLQGSSSTPVEGTLFIGSTTTTTPLTTTAASVVSGLPFTSNAGLPANACYIVSFKGTNSGSCTTNDVTFELKINGTSVVSHATTASAIATDDFRICNIPGSTTSQSYHNLFFATNAQSSKSLTLTNANTFDYTAKCSTGGTANLTPYIFEIRQIKASL